VRKNAINKANFSFFGAMRKALFVYIILACSLWGCIKPPQYSIIPHIEFVSVSSPNAIANLPDTITFSFTDGDGDIGVSGINDSTTNTCGLKYGDSSILHLSTFNVFLIDSRDSCIETFASANVQPTGKYKGISGNIQVITNLSNLRCFSCPCTAVDTVTYAIILRDMAGHLSNTIHTIPISVSCPQ
jgi:hypothetical protein